MGIDSEHNPEFEAVAHEECRKAFDHLPWSERVKEHGEGFIVLDESEEHMLLLVDRLPDRAPGFQKTIRELHEGASPTEYHFNDAGELVGTGGTNAEKAIDFAAILNSALPSEDQPAHSQRAEYLTAHRPGSTLLDIEA